MITSKKIFGFAAATFVAASLAAGAANAGITSISGPAIDSLPTAGIQMISHSGGYRFRRCYGFG
ncbi:MAG: hypothetical protein ACTSUD_01470, partial [Alphaproteobacteria bacterium]